MVLYELVGKDSIYSRGDFNININLVRSLSVTPHCHSEAQAEESHLDAFAFLHGESERPFTSANLRFFASLRMTNARTTGGYVIPPLQFSSKSEKVIHH